MTATKRGGKKKAGKKRPAKRPARGPKKDPAPNLVPQLHGGAIHQGAPTNPRAGSGRPRSATRDAAHLAFDDRLGILGAVADGDVVQRIAVPLYAVLEHARCPKCQGKLEPNDVKEILVGIEGRVSASPRDRVGAMKLLADVGSVTSRQLSIDVVREKLKEQNKVIRDMLPPDQAKTLLARMGAVWKGSSE